MTLSIVGGTYIEYCFEPSYEELWGSGLRASCALSKKGFAIKFTSFVGEGDFESATGISETFEIESNFIKIEETIRWEYTHPLASPLAYSKVLANPRIDLQLKEEIILYYGMIEANVKVTGEYVVYDPQNDVPFSTTKSVAKHLAIVLNKQQAEMHSGISECTLEQLGKNIIEKEKAEVVIIKDGPNGGVVITNKSSDYFPVFETKSVWPIGSGDIFSAVFAWKWAIEKINPVDAANLASQYTASFCESRVIPLENSGGRKPIKLKKSSKKIFLTGPFDNFPNKLVINEVRESLIRFGGSLLSNLIDIGRIPDLSKEMTLKAIFDNSILQIQNCDVVFAILYNNDEKTIFEIDYALTKKKLVIILTEKLDEPYKAKFSNENCFITSDFATAVYRSSW